MFLYVFLYLFYFTFLKWGINLRALVALTIWAAYSVAIFHLFCIIDYIKIKVYKSKRFKLDKVICGIYNISFCF